MKYEKELYEETEFYGENDEETNHTQKVVKCRKEHICCNCKAEIKKGDDALCEKAIIQGEGRQTCYTCIKCCDEWLDEIYDDEEDEEEEA